jgi:hypothetical protein
MRSGGETSVELQGDRARFTPSTDGLELMLPATAAGFSDGINAAPTRDFRSHRSREQRSLSPAVSAEPILVVGLRAKLFQKELPSELEIGLTQTAKPEATKFQ